MLHNDITFPLYRKFNHNRSFFKIVSPTQFVEIQIMGERYFKYEIHAKILPDFQLITDMINLHNNHWEVANEDDFNRVFSEYKNSMNA
jgi:hypothetical protein